VKAVVAELLAAIVAAALAALAGWFAAGEIGAELMALGAVTFFFLRQLWLVLRLIRWAACPLGTPTPSASGVWGVVFDALYRRGRLASAEREQATQELDRFAAPQRLCPTA